jgi:hypothetical protein
MTMCVLCNVSYKFELNCKFVNCVFFYMFIISVRAFFVIFFIFLFYSRMRKVLLGITFNIRRKGTMKLDHVFVDQLDVGSFSYDGTA